MSTGTRATTDADAAMIVASDVSLLGFALVCPTSTLFAPYGARLAHGLNPRHLNRVFGVLLGITAIWMF